MTTSAVGTISAVGSSPTKESPRVHEVEPERTKVSVSELRSALSNAYEKLSGKPPSATMLDALTGQASLETGRGTSMYNFNFGGIKGASPESGGVAHCKTTEVISGKTVKMTQGFRAYLSLEEGATDYVSLLQRKYGDALTHAESGDLTGFVHALKQKGYFTASETQYASAVRKLAGEASGVDYTPSGNPTTIEDHPLRAPAMSVASAMNDPVYPTETTLARILDSVQQSSARIAQPLGDTNDSNDFNGSSNSGYANDWGAKIT